MSNATLDRLKTWLARGRHRYRIQVLDENDFGFKRSFRLSLFQLGIFFASLIIVMVLLTIYLVAFTGLREYIPGYSDPSLKIKTLGLELRTDSLDDALNQRDLMFQNIQRVLSGEPLPSYLPAAPDSSLSQTGPYSRSPEDSLLRLEMENSERFALNSPRKRPSNLPDALLFPPVNGLVTDSFDMRRKHYGIDLSTDRNEAVKSILDGVVVYADWSLESGYTLIVQHDFNLVSVYKHNAVVLKAQGEVVGAGEPIGIVGNSGELSSGPHLHFEIWYEGLASNPLDWIRF